ncbi:Regulator of nonsense transcripts upf2 [Cymbomonas tetramitiformis]|uniref:Regulator of nonsense transcripts upf2 n=1 Tax=Cymbomonas tetramitiformis TaxID=36881 RepID=A0AAE0H5A6_9CHLO|nr:Regulator of nonsense transcripts upf2 [Cymbomonas tetramitiformis]
MSGSAPNQNRQEVGAQRWTPKESKAAESKVVTKAADASSRKQPGQGSPRPSKMPEGATASLDEKDSFSRERLKEKKRHASDGKRGKGDRKDFRAAEKDSAELQKKREEELEAERLRKQAGEEAKEKAQQEAAKFAKEEEERKAAERAAEEACRAEEARAAIRLKRNLRAENINPVRPEEEKLKTLDSSIKRNTALIKKLRQLSEEGHKGLMEDIRKVNASRYVSEVVAAIAEAKIKMSDVPAAVQVCSELHQRYVDFSAALIPALQRVLLHGSGKGAAASDAAEAPTPARKRVMLRLLSELLIVGLYSDPTQLCTVIKELAVMDFGRDKDGSLSNITLLANFAKQAREELLYREDAEAKSAEAEAEAGEPSPQGGVERTSLSAPPEVCFSLSPEQQQPFRALLETLFETSCASLVTEHSAMQHAEQVNARTLEARGELSEETQANYEKQRKYYDQLLRSVASLASSIDRAMPELPEETVSRVAEVCQVSMGSTAGVPTEQAGALWEDEEMRTFYESLPDLRAFVPALLLGDTDPSGGNAGTGGVTAATEDEKDESAASSASATTDAATKGAAEKIDDKDDKTSADGGGVALEHLMARLPNCVNRDVADSFAVDFCYLNSKGARKRLVRTLFAAPRNALELLPYYSRISATLAQYLKDIGPLLVSWLDEEFGSLLHKKDPLNLESKIRNIRFLGELTKFKITPPSVIFGCLKKCYDDFTHHNIDIACHLLESCGRFLFRSPETSVRAGNMLDILWRLRKAKNLSAAQSTLVENAYYQCKPPERSAVRIKQRTPMQEYIRHLLYIKLSRTTIEKVLRQLRKLPWPECEDYIMRCVLKVCKARYSQLSLCASIAAGLCRYHSSLGVSIVDNLIEEIRIGMQSNVSAAHQRRIAQMRLVGELYNYRLVDSKVVFELLYMVLSWGYDAEAEKEAVLELDPPCDFFRIRLVVTLLETCGAYFDRGSSKRKLDAYLAYFQRYILSKPALPMDVEFDVADLLQMLRPDLVRLTSFDAACKQCAQMEEDASESVKGEATMPGTTGKGDESDSESERGDDESDNEEFGEEEEEGEGLGGHGTEEEAAEGYGSTTLEEEEEEEVVVRSRTMVQEEGEEEAGLFEREFQAMMQESLGQAKLTKSAPLNMPVPSINAALGLGGVERRTHAAEEEPASSARWPVESPSGGVQAQESVPFRLLMKKGGKPQSRALQVPVESALARSTLRKEEQELEERSELKRLVLDYHHREEEEHTAYAPALRSIRQPALPIAPAVGLHFIDAGSRGAGGAHVPYHPTPRGSSGTGSGSGTSGRRRRR